MTPPNIVSSLENIPTIEPFYEGLLQLLDNNLHLVIPELEIAFEEFQTHGHELKKGKLIQEDDISNVISTFFCNIQEIFNFKYQPKDPEKNGGTDIGILKKYGSPRHVPLCYIEAKILPTPINSKKRQETEYVCYRNLKKQGGIERFKTGAHASRKSMSIMFAYVQKEDFSFWFDKVNSWIKEEITSSSNSLIAWHTEDILIQQNVLNQENVTKYSSVHTRVAPLTKVELIHYWINLS